MRFRFQSSQDHHLCKRLALLSKILLEGNLTSVQHCDFNTCPNGRLPLLHYVCHSLHMVLLLPHSLGYTCRESESRGDMNHPGVVAKETDRTAQPCFDNLKNNCKITQTTGRGGERKKPWENHGRRSHGKTSLESRLVGFLQNQALSLRRNKLSRLQCKRYSQRAWIQSLVPHSVLSSPSIKWAQ